MNDLTLHPYIPPRDALIGRHRSYTRALAVEVLSELNSPSRLDLEELVAYGELGLVEAAERYDPRRGVQFTTFAYYRIRGAIYDGLRQMGWLSRAEYRRARFAAAANELRQCAADDAAPAETSLEEELTAVRSALDALIPVYLLSLDSTENLPEMADRAESHAALLEAEELRRLMRTLVAELSADDRLIIEEIYYKNRSMVELAATLGASKSWVSRLHARAVRRLREVMERHGLLSAA